jgi:hypothetical protein
MPDTQPGATGAMTPVRLWGPQRWVAGRGFGASAPGMRSFRPTRGTPMWSGPRRLPAPVIAPAEEQPGSHIPPSRNCVPGSVR